MSLAPRPDVPPPRREPAESARLTVAPSQPRPGLLVVRILGELDSDSAVRCGRVLRGAVDSARQERDLRGAHGHVVCDVADLEFLTVAGLHVLVDLEEYARELDIELTVVVGDDEIRRVMHRAGLDRRMRTSSRLAPVLAGGHPG